MKKIVKEFYQKNIALNKFFSKKKKVSFDTNENLLNLIDKLAKLSSNNRTMIINAFIGEGMLPFFDRLERTWTEYLERYEGKSKEEVKKNTRKLIEDLKKLKEECYQIE